MNGAALACTSFDISFVTIFDDVYFLEGCNQSKTVWSQCRFLISTLIRLCILFCRCYNYNAPLSKTYITFVQNTVISNTASPISNPVPVLISNPVLFCYYFDALCKYTAGPCITGVLNAALAANLTITYAQAESNYAILVYDSKNWMCHFHSQLQSYCTWNKLIDLYYFLKTIQVENWMSN